MKNNRTLKNLVSAFILLTGLQSTQAFASQSETQPEPKEVVIGLSDVYVPAGFDSEADSYVIVNGIFPNGCYRWKGAEVSHKGDFNHEIKSKALVSQGLCIMVLMPFTKEVRLGQLASGTHNLKFVSGDGTYMEKTMKVE